MPGGGGGGLMAHLVGNPALADAVTKTMVPKPNVAPRQPPLFGTVQSAPTLGQSRAELLKGFRPGASPLGGTAPSMDMSEGLGSAWARAQIAGKSAATKPATARPATRSMASRPGGDWAGNDFDYDSPTYDPGGYNAPGTGWGIDDDFDDYGSYAGEGPSGDPGYGYDTDPADDDWGGGDWGGDDWGGDDGGYDDGDFGDF